MGVELVTGGYGGTWGNLNKEIAFFHGIVEGNVSLRDKFDVGAQHHPRPSFGDLDNDGDLDILVYGVYNFFLKWFENTGNKDKAIFTERSTSMAHRLEP